jgi:hypothetical protein
MAAGGTGMLGMAEAGGTGMLGMAAGGTGMLGMAYAEAAKPKPRTKAATLRMFKRMRISSLRAEERHAGKD